MYQCYIKNVSFLGKDDTTPQAGPSRASDDRVQVSPQIGSLYIQVDDKKNPQKNARIDVSCCPSFYPSCQSIYLSVVHS